MIHHRSYLVCITYTNALGYLDDFPMMSALVYVMSLGQDLEWIMMLGYQLL